MVEATIEARPRGLSALADRGIGIRIYPTKEQESIMLKLLETHRHLYNNALAQRKTAYEAEQKTVKYMQYLRQKSWPSQMPEGITSRSKTQVQSSIVATFASTEDTFPPG